MTRIESSSTQGPPFRADHVGSLLRPAPLLALRKQLERGEVSAVQLRALEDDCIREVVAMQEALGLQSVTDGEFRRGSFHGEFISRLQGVEFRQRPASPDDPAGSRTPFVAYVTQRLQRPAGGIEVENFRFLYAATRATAKQTLPSPTMLHFRGGRDAIDSTVYPDIEDFLADLARVYREEVADLAAAGCRYLQLDDTNLAYLCDEGMRADAARRGENVDLLPQRYARLINESLASRPPDMGVCIHLCRGNARSRWFAQGGYEPVAEVLFNAIDVDGFFLEYDDERSGDFAPLRFVPPGKRVVLGLLTSKRGELEDAEAIKRRIDEAARILPLDQLCLSPQCGFASASEGNLLSEEDEKRKLALIVKIAEEMWG